MKTILTIVSFLGLGLLGLQAQFAEWFFAPEPTVASSDPSQGIVNCHELQIEFTPGNGNRRVIVMRAGMPVDKLPVDGQDYTANSVFGNGSNLGNGNFVVYDGVGSAVTVTGLQEGVNYHHAIFEYNGTGSNTNYLTSQYLSLNRQFPLDPVAEVSKDNISCFGAEDGSVALNVSEGTTPYQVDWSTGETGKSLSSLEAGNYSYTVTDSVGCSVNGEVEIIEPDSILVIVETENVACHGESNGSISLGVSGGVGGFTYEWSNGATTPDLEGLASGTYEVVVTDRNGCKASKSITIEEPPALGVERAVQNPSCAGNADGSVELAPFGGITPYEINWSSGASTFQISNLPAGSYGYTITDGNGCEHTGEILLDDPEPLNYDAAIYDISCHGAGDGLIELSLSGGTEPYTVNWSDGSQGLQRQQLEAGDYGVTITDANGCEQSTGFAIFEPDPLSMELQAGVVTCEYKTDGTIAVEVSGGTQPYDFTWSDGGTSKDRQFLETGNYEVTVTDANGCQVLGGAKVEEASTDLADCSVEIEVFDIFTPNGDGTNESFVIRNIQEYPKNQLEIYNRWGLKVYDVRGYQNNWKGVNNKGKELPPGAYYYVLKVSTTSTQTFTGSITFLR